jgi:glycosyltransferase involved in cell wall biosynthesis
MEALALGTPILSTTVGCVSENLAGGGAAIFYPPDNDRLLAEAITRLVREPELRARLHAEARPAYEKHFAFDRFGREFSGLLDETIGTLRPNEHTGHET